MASVQLFETAVQQLELRRARVTAATDCFLKGQLSIEELRRESEAAAAAEKVRDETLRRWREPSSREAAKAALSSLSEAQRARLQQARRFIDEQLNAAMVDVGLDPDDSDDLDTARGNPSTRALRRALAALEADVSLLPS